MDQNRHSNRGSTLEQRFGKTLCSIDKQMNSNKVLSNGSNLVAHSNVIRNVKWTNNLRNLLLKICIRTDAFVQLKWVDDDNALELRRPDTAGATLIGSNAHILSRKKCTNTMISADTAKRSADAKYTKSIHTNKQTEKCFSCTYETEKERTRTKHTQKKIAHIHTLAHDRHTHTHNACLVLVLSFLWEKRLPTERVRGAEKLILHCSQLNF